MNRSWLMIAAALSVVLAVAVIWKKQQIGPTAVQEPHPQRAAVPARSNAIVSVDSDKASAPRAALKADTGATEEEIAMAEETALAAVTNAVATTNGNGTNVFLFPTYNGYRVNDPVARIALNFVGLDEGATEYWLEAINDPTVPAEERKDLIEDLNETGFEDPHQPTEDDLPLIWQRMQLIEALAPESMDAVNAAAFEEAYRDLASMAQGEMQP